MPDSTASDVIACVLLFGCAWYMYVDTRDSSIISAESQLFMWPQPGAIVTCTVEKLPVFPYREKRREGKKERGAYYTRTQLFSFLIPPLRKKRSRTPQRCSSYRPVEMACKRQHPLPRFYVLVRLFGSYSLRKYTQKLPLICYALLDYERSCACFPE